jgi:hypothetical protein
MCPASRSWFLNTTLQEKEKGSRRGGGKAKALRTSSSYLPFLAYQGGHAAIKLSSPQNLEMNRGIN